MSFQAYLDAIETRTGLTPRQLIDVAERRGYAAPEVKAKVILEWLRTEYDLGRGHGMALVHVIKNGPTAPAKHIRSGTSHSDPTETLWLDGKDSKPA